MGDLTNRVKAFQRQLAKRKNGAIEDVLTEKDNLESVITAFTSFVKLLLSSNPSTEELESSVTILEARFPGATTENVTQGVGKVTWTLVESSQGVSALM
jgi:hypothetical protein